MRNSIFYRTSIVQVSLFDLEANPSLLLTTDPNLEFSRNENIPMMQSVELKDQNTNENFFATQSVSASTNQNSPKNNLLEE